MHELRDAVTLHDDLFELTGEHGLDLVKESPAALPLSLWQLGELHILSAAPSAPEEILLREILLPLVSNTHSDIVICQAT